MKKGNRFIKIFNYFAIIFFIISGFRHIIKEDDYYRAIIKFVFALLIILLQLVVYKREQMKK